jgi:hypothetical protein
MARQLGGCRILLVEELANPRLASEWTEADGLLEISIATAARGEHDVAMEVLLCLGQALWTKLDSAQRKAYWLLLDRETGAGVTGEIDEHGLKQKRLLLAGVHSATSSRRLEKYGAASFAGTAAEYVHSLWHDVSVRRGRDFLPAPRLKARLELLARWFPPAPGYRLFPADADAPRGPRP